VAPCIHRGWAGHVIAGCNRAGDAAAPGFRGIDITGAPYGRDFRLTDVDGQERTLADYRGKLVLLYFGFVQCPDVCPTALTRAVETKRLLGPDGDRLQVIFITVDPERDTPEVILREYMAAFDPSFVALRGDAQRTEAKPLPSSRCFTGRCPPAAATPWTTPRCLTCSTRRAACAWRCKP
jgi:protein SCO1/2